MKRTAIILGMALAIGAGSALAFQSPGGGMHADPEARLLRMQEHLDLSDSQVAQIRAIHEQDIPRREMREQVRATLSKEQLAKLEAHRGAMRERHEQRRKPPCPPDAPDAPDAPA